MKCFFVTIVILLSLHNAHAAEPLSLSKLTDLQSYQSVLRKAESEGFSKAQIDGSQSFQLKRGAVEIGALVAGSGLSKGEAAQPGKACFLALRETEGTITFVPTIGGGEWEASTCSGIEAVGLIDDGARRRSILAVLYRAASPNASTMEPVLLRLDEMRPAIRVDADATRRASLAGAVSIKAIQALFRR